MKKLLMLVSVVVIITSAFGQSRNISLKDIQENYFFCVSSQKIEEAFENATVEKCKITKDAEEKYKKFCFFKVESSDFSQIMIISEAVEDPNAQLTCAYMEFFYEKRILYLPKKDEKIYWQASNLLNNTAVTTDE